MCYITYINIYSFFIVDILDNERKIRFNIA